MVTKERALEAPEDPNQDHREQQGDQERAKAAQAIGKEKEHAEVAPL